MANFGSSEVGAFDNPIIIWMHRPDRDATVGEFATSNLREAVSDLVF